MPDPRDGHNLLFLNHLIYNPIRAKDDFTNIFIIFFRHNPSQS